MPDNLLQAAPAAPVRPSEIPEKFWDAEAGALRVEALLKSYRELERRLSQRLAPPAEGADEEERRRWREMLDIPEAPEGYAIEARHELCGPDPAINARLLPLIAEAAQQFEADRQTERLHAHFGGEERFRRLAAQASAWGRSNLPPAVFEALATTCEGVIALERMMQGGEPGLARDAAAPAAMDEGELRRMMRDPRYWRQREPEFVRRVTDGFRKLVNG